MPWGIKSSAKPYYQMFILGMAKNKTKENGTSREDDEIVFIIQTSCVFFCFWSEAVGIKPSSRIRNAKECFIPIHVQIQKN